MLKFNKLLSFVVSTLFVMQGHSSFALSQTDYDQLKSFQQAYASAPRGATVAQIAKESGIPLSRLSQLVRGGIEDAGVFSPEAILVADTMIEKFTGRGTTYHGPTDFSGMGETKFNPKEIEVKDTIRLTNLTKAEIQSLIPPTQYADASSSLAPDFPSIATIFIGFLSRFNY